MSFHAASNAEEEVESATVSDWENASSTNGCSILLLHAPPKLQIGLDYCIWEVTRKFAGVSSIPAGVHYLYWSNGVSGTPLVPVDKKASLSPVPPLLERLETDRQSDRRCGCFVYLRNGEVATWRWDGRGASFLPLEQEEHQYYVDGVLHGDFIGNMAPFGQEFWGPWRQISQFVTAAIVEQIEPVKKFIRQTDLSTDTPDKLVTCDQRDASMKPVRSQPFTQATAIKDTVASGPDQSDDTATLSSQRATDAAIPNTVSSKAKASNRKSRSRYVAPSLPYGATLFYSTIPKVTIAPNAIPSEITRLSMDRSEALERLIKDSYNGNEWDVLGELQFAYIAFLLGYHWESFLQWKELLLLLCDSEKAAVQRPSLFLSLLSVMRAQLEQAPDDLFTDELLHENFLIHCMINLIDICDYETAPKDLKDARDAFVKLIEQKFNVDMNEIAFLSGEGPQIC